MAFHFQRRRLHYYHRFRFLLPLISAISGALLVLFALLLVLAPSPLDVNNLHQRRHSSTFDVAVDDDAVAARFTVFRVPSGGGRLDRDIWSSRNSKFYYGCSNGTKKFPNVDEITRPNRYLAIATSGGLNQQRTGGIDGIRLGEGGEEPSRASRYQPNTLDRQCPTTTMLSLRDFVRRRTGIRGYTRPLRWQIPQLPAPLLCTTLWNAPFRRRSPLVSLSLSSCSSVCFPPDETGNCSAIDCRGVVARVENSSRNCLKAQSKKLLRAASWLHLCFLII